MQLTFTIDTIKDTCIKVLDSGKADNIWAFYGDMGVGKTTFIHYLCDLLGVTSPISSPTYSIINEYKIKEEEILYHMDWYRLKDEREAVEAGVEECLYSGHLCFIEWPQKAAVLLPENYFRLTLQTIDFDTRKITVGSPLT